MKIAVMLISAALLSSPAHASSECGWVGNEWIPVACDHKSPYSGCAERTVESIKAHQDCEDGLAARDAALIALASRVGVEDLAGKSVYGWHYVISTEGGKHQFDLIDLLTKTLDKVQAKSCKPGECPATME